MNQSKTRSNSIFIQIADCKIKLFYYYENKITRYLKNFIIPSCDNFDFSIYFSNHTSYLSRRYNRNNKILINQKINKYAFQYILRNILQDHFGSKKSGFFLHCSSVLNNNKAHIFLGPSGSGKSTISQLLPESTTVLTDDAAIILKGKNNYYMHQTPFIENIKSNKSPRKYRISKIYFIYKADFCKITKLSDKSDILKMFINQLWTDKQHLNIQLDILIHFIHEFNQFYRLDFLKNKQEVTACYRKFAG